MHVYYCDENLLLTESESTYRQKMGHRKGETLISTGFGFLQIIAGTTSATVQSII